MAPEPIRLLSIRRENPMPRIEPRFYDCPSRNVTTLLNAVPPIFTTATEVNKKCDIHMILLVRVCMIQQVLTASAPQLSAYA